MTKKKTTEEYTKELFEANPFVVPLTPYTTTKGIMKFRCKICGREYEATAYRELRRVGPGC